MRKLDSTLFDWLHWRNGSPTDLLVVCREHEIIRAKMRIREYAIGWCNGENLVCRPKLQHKAVMYHKNGVDFWFHLTNKEFYAIFPELGC